MAHPKSIPSRGPIAKPHHLPHPWTRPTYDAKWHPDQIRRFSTMHWTVRLTDRSRESLTTIGRYTMRATRPNTNASVVYAVIHCEKGENLDIHPAVNIFT